MVKKREPARKSPTSAARATKSADSVANKEKQKTAEKKEPEKKAKKRPTPAKAPEESSQKAATPPAAKNGGKIVQIDTSKKTPKEIRTDRIKAEVKRLTRIFVELEDEKKEMIHGLIRRAAFMRVQLEDLEEYLNENGWTELFQQGEQKPYMRARPEGQIYNSTNKNYQSIMKQLSDLMPEDSAREEAESLLNFVGMRK